MTRGPWKKELTPIIHTFLDSVHDADWYLAYSEFGGSDFLKIKNDAIA